MMFACFESENPIRREAARRQPQVLKDRIEAHQLSTVLDGLFDRQIIATDNREIIRMCIDLKRVLNDYR